jgi:hypothetical protein
MTIPQNRATPAQVAAYREGLRRNLTVPPDPKRRYRMPALLEPCVHPYLDGWSVQMAIRVKAPQLRAHPDPRKAFGMQKMQRRLANEMISQVMTTLQASCGRRVSRARIEHITFTRISPGRLDRKDNVRAAFKHVCDATCAWLIRGDDFNEEDRQNIGKFDAQAERMGITWDYQQETNAEDRRRHGIRIYFRLKPR